MRGCSLLMAAGIGVGLRMLLGGSASSPPAGARAAVRPPAPRWEAPLTRAVPDAARRAPGPAIGDDTAGAALAGPRAVPAGRVGGLVRRFLASVSAWEAGRRGGLRGLRASAAGPVLRRLPRGPPAGAGLLVGALRAYREGAGWTVVVELRPRSPAGALELRVGRDRRGALRVEDFDP